MKYYQELMEGNYESRVLPFLWQKGESREVIETYLTKIKESDIHEVCLESRPHPHFCEQEWWEDLAFIIDICKKLDMKLWLLDDSHFPTGYANGAIKEHPELRKTVLTHRCFDLIGPQMHTSIYLKNMFDPTENFYGALMIQDGVITTLPYTRIEDQLLFDVPKGKVKICVIFTSKQSGFRDEYINMVDYASCRALIDAVYEPHYEHFKEEFGKTILGFFSDEPGFMNEKGNQADSLIGKSTMCLPWSDALEERLKKALGETYLISLPALWMDLAQSPFVRHTYMDVATTLYQECFDEQLGTWCREHSVMHIGHVIEDKDSHARLGVGAGHYFRALAGQDMAGVDIVINQLVPGMDEGMHAYGRGEWDMEFFNYALAKLGSSLANIDPLKKGRCMAEVFGAFGWHEGLKEMKWIADHFLVRGVNYFVPHAFSQAQFPDIDCPPHFYAHGNNPQFPYFSTLMRYMNQMGTLFSDGQPHPTAAVLYHADGEWCGDILEMQKVARELTRNQIDFDFVPMDVFHNRLAKLQDGGLCINGITYRCFLLPYQEYISSELWDFVKEAKEHDFPIYAVDGLPKALYDGKGTDFSLLSSIPLNDLAKTLHEDGMYDIKTSTYEPWLRSYHYTKAGEEYVMLVNEHPQISIDTKLNLTGTKVSLLERTEVAFDGHLNLAPYESCLIVMEAKSCAEKERKYECMMTLDGPWDLSFSTSREYPNFKEEGCISTLSEWNPMQQRCGIFAYETEFVLTKPETELMLWIKEAYETVCVFVDNQEVGHRIAPPYRFLLPLLSEGRHLLRIEVINTLDKEIHDLFSLGEAMEPSGLIGPVYLKTRAK